MTAPLLAVAGLSKSFGAFRALSDVSLTLAPSERLGIIGPNGSGKTTLINCIAGTLIPEAGQVAYEGRDVTRLPAHRRARPGIARSFQIHQPFTGMSVSLNLLLPLNHHVHCYVLCSLAQWMLRSVALAMRADDPSAFV